MKKIKKLMRKVNKGYIEIKLIPNHKLRINSKLTIWTNGRILVANDLNLENLPTGRYEFCDGDLIPASEGVGFPDLEAKLETIKEKTKSYSPVVPKKIKENLILIQLGKNQAVILGKEKIIETRAPDGAILERSFLVEAEPIVLIDKDYFDYVIAEIDIAPKWKFKNSEKGVYVSVNSTKVYIMPIIMH